jgi:hypothetical protein
LLRSYHESAWQRRKHITPLTLGADKGYCSRAFVRYLRGRGIRVHIARIERRRTPGLGARTMRNDSYRASQRKRKRIDEIFGRLQTVGGLRKTRIIGIERTQLQANLAASAYNLLRMARLALTATQTVGHDRNVYSPGSASSATDRAQNADQYQSHYSIRRICISLLDVLLFILLSAGKRRRREIDSCQSKLNHPRLRLSTRISG